MEAVVSPRGADPVHLGQVDSPRWTFGPFQVDTHHDIAFRDSEPLDIQPLVIQTLRLLVSSVGALVTYQLLNDVLWPDTRVTESSIFQAIRKARRVLGEHRGWIQTARGEGYRFVGPARLVVPELLHPGGPLFGRDALLNHLREQLSSGRVLTLVGPPGVGKSALAHSIAKSGVWPTNLVDLGPLEEGDVRDAIAGMDAPWKSASPRARRLLVLDNAEHVASVAARHIATLATERPGAVWLTTSRRPLGLVAEQQIRVPPLDEGAASALFRNRLGSAGSEVPEDRLTGVVQGLGGLPLSIHLAASRARTRGLDAVTADSSLQPAQPPADAPDHHQDLDRAIERSWNLLSHEARELGESLSVFVSGFGPAQAAQLGRAEALDELVLQSLVELARPDPARYRMVDAVRRYGLARLERGGGLERAFGRHAEALRSTTPEIRASSTDSVVQRVVENAPEIRAAWRRLRHRPELTGPALYKLCIALWRRQDWRGRFELVSEAVDALAPHGPSVLLARFQIELAAALSVAGDLDGANAEARAACETADAVGEESVRYRAYHRYGQSLANRRSLNGHLLDELQAMTRTDPVRRYQVAQLRASFAQDEGQSPHVHFSEATAAARAGRLVALEARSLHLRAEYEFAQGNLDATVGLVREALEVLGSPSERPEHYLLNCVNLAFLATHSGKLEVAREWLDRALEVAGRSYTENNAFRLMVEGDLAQAHGNLEAAFDWYGSTWRLLAANHPGQGRRVAGRQAINAALRGRPSEIEALLARVEPIAVHTERSTQRLEAALAWWIAGEDAEALDALDVSNAHRGRSHRREHALSSALRSLIEGEPDRPPLAGATPDVVATIEAARMDELPSHPGELARLARARCCAG